MLDMPADEIRHVANASGSLIVIHVNRSFIAASVKYGIDLPFYTIKHKGKVTYCHGYVCDGASRGVQPGKALSCGARAWIETNGPITYIRPMTFAQAKALLDGYKEQESFSEEV